MPASAAGRRLLSSEEEEVAVACKIKRVECPSTSANPTSKYIIIQCRGFEFRDEIKMESVRLPLVVNLLSHIGKYG